MYWNIAAVLGILWLLGLLSGHTLGGGIHLLLAGAIVMLVYAFRQWWRRPA